MDPRALMAVIVKTAGLLLLLYALMQLPDRVASYVLSPERSGDLLLGLVVFPAAISLAVGVLLFWFPATVASVAAGTRLVETPAAERMLQAVIFAGIGLYTALQSALNLAYYVALFAHTDVDYENASLGDPKIPADVIANVVGLVLGLVLLFSARGVAALVSKIRNAR